MKKIYDLTVIGNGMVGSYSFLEIRKRYRDININFVHDKKRPGSASAAAGAMLNVFGEIDYDKQMDNYQQRKIDIGILSQKKWKNFFKENDEYIKCNTAKNTIIYKSKNATKLEKNCFKEIKKWNDKYNFKNHNLSKQILKYKKKIKNINSPLDEFIGISGEGAVDTNLFFSIFDKNLKNNKKTTISLDKILTITKYKNYYKILGNKNYYYSKKIIVCAGSDSSKILSNITKKIMPIFYGVGTAFVAHPKKNEFEALPKNTVLRSPNRGSTCGLHVVPRNDKTYYIGAGSFISKSKIKSFGRVETIKYLTNSLQKELIGPAPYLEFIPVVGYRPISFDCKPLIGMINNHPDIFFISGTKRDGLTYSPVISDAIINWLDNNKNYELFKNWEPERKPLSYGDTPFAIESYIENKIAGLIEHNNENKKNYKKIYTELKFEANQFHKNIIKKLKLKKDFGIHPEILNIY